jgi:hypothetical protein
MGRESWARRTLLGLLLLLCGCACVLAAGSKSARAAVAHEFLKPLSEELEKGAPAGQPVSGALSGVTALSADNGRLWVAERMEAGKYFGRSRVDAFNDSTGSFSAQLQEEGGVSELDAGIAVGHPGGQEETYVGALKEHQSVLAAYGPGRTLQVEGVWSGANTANKSFGAIAGVAVDASASLETRNDVYVATSHFNGGADVVDVFPGEAGGAEPAPSGQLTGTCETGGEVPPACAGSKFIPFSETVKVTKDEIEEEEIVGRVTGVAVSVNGDVLVANGDGEQCVREQTDARCEVDVFEPVPGLPGAYTFLFAIKGAPGEPFKRIGPMAVDNAGDIYVIEKQTNVVQQFGVMGEYMGKLTGTSEGSPFREVRSIAADQASGEIYIGDFNQTLKSGAVDAFGPSAIVPDVKSEAASAIGLNGSEEIEATLHGSVDPLSEGGATCAFIWGTSAAFGQNRECEPPGVTAPNTMTPVKAKLSGLAPDSTYSFRLQASNKNGTNPGEAGDDMSFETPGPGIHGESATKISSSSADLGATIDPNNAPTSYYFQYGSSSANEAQVPAAPSTLGEGKGDVQVSPQHIQGLLPETLYHYRVVAVSELPVGGSPGQAVAFAGAEQSFITQGATAGPPLPDGRKWELVSPVNKHGALLRLGAEGGITEAAADGSGISYVASLPTEESVKGYVYLGVQGLASRGAEGWSSQDLTTAHATTQGQPLGVGDEYRYFTAELAQGILEPLGEFSSLAPEVFPPDSQRGPYLRQNGTCASTPGTCFRPLLVACPGEGQACDRAVEENANVAAGTKFGGDPTQGFQHSFVGEARFLDASGDAKHVILGSPVALTGAGSGETTELYEYSGAAPAAQQLQLVSVLPESEAEAPAQGEVSLGFKSAVMRHAISEDGRRVFWSAGEHLYVRDTVKDKTLQLDLPQCSQAEECGEEEASARFQLAGADGSRVLFTDQQRLTGDAGRLPGKADLYECQIEEVAAGLSCKLTDLTPASGAHQGADVQGAVTGASEDGSWVYFVANGLLGDGAVRGGRTGDCSIVGEVGEGQCNLYSYHEGQTHLIATLSGEDYPDWSGKAVEQLSKLTARVSPSGQWLTFMSNRPLTGYDNHDAVMTGKADEEVFLYHAEGAASGTLSCASCNPNGARPEGIEYRKIEGQLVGNNVAWPPSTGIAASIPGYSPYELGRALYQPRYLSDSGRLFFDTSDALVAQDINKNQDVYQYEPPGMGDCSSASVSFSASSGGCVALISSGVASGESAFADASESGDDVFFLTNEQLVEKDVDTALDLYDAHVCSSAVPCTEEAQSPPPCTTAESCRAAPSPQPTIFGAPASATFSGEGNVKAPTTAPAPTKSKATRAQLLAKALATCRKKYKKAKKRRASCERQARSRYGAKPAKKAKAKSKKAAKKGAKR